MTSTPTVSPPRSRKCHLLPKLFWPALLLSVAAFSSRPAQAQSPAAGSSIGNQATATYTDSGNVPRSTQSNTVITTVSQVAAVTLTETQTVDKTPGSPVFFPHTIRNTGNGTDTFNLTVTESGTDNFNIGAVIYPDANGDGQPDNFTPITTTGPIAANSTFTFVIGGTVPASATAGQAGVVTVRAASVFDPTVLSLINTDTVNVTANAAVSILKTISAPSGTPPTTAVPVPAPGDPNTYTYTLQYTNTGNQAANALTLTDTVPAGFTYVPGSGRWSVTGATALTDPAGGDPAGITYQNVGGVVTAVVATVPTNTTGNISFQVFLQNGVAPQTITNRVDITYDDDNNAGTPVRTGTDTVDFQVNPATGVTFTGPPTVGPVNQGSTVLFPNTLTNTGTGTDRFDVVVNTPGTFPAGSTFRLLQSDGATTLQDSNGNQIPDTGPVLAGASYVVYLEVRLPSGIFGTGPFTVTKTATSVTTPGVTATATDTLTPITQSQVELTNGPGNAGAGVITATPVTTLPVAPGGTAVFQLNIQNLVGNADTYALSYTTGTGPAFSFTPATPLPAGFTLVFRTANDPNAPVVTNVGPIAPLASRTVFAFVTAPAGAVAASYDLGFRVLSATTGASDVKFDRVTVSANRSLAVEPNNASQIFPGATKNYVHTVTNTGNQTEGPIAIALSGDANGFSSVAYLDTNGNGILDGTEANTPLASIPSLAPGASASVIVRVFAPLGASDGLQNTTTLTASVAGGPSDVATDTTTVVTGDLIVVKEQSVDPDGPGAAFGFGPYTQGTATVRPGGFIRYRITATNTGGAPVTGVGITDVPPALTGYSAGDTTISATGVAAYTLDNGATFTALTGANGTTPAVGARTQVIANIPTIANGQAAIVYFQVTVAP